MQVHSSNWYSCAMVYITPKGCTNCNAPPPPALTCNTVTAGSLSFCPSVTSAMVLATTTPAEINTEITTTYNTNIANPNVFGATAAATTACQTLYTQLLCAINLPACNANNNTLIADVQACHAQCQKTMDACDIQPAHISLYDCDSLPLCPGEPSNAKNGGKGGSSGGGGGMTPGGKAALSLFFIGLVGVAAFAGFTYHKQGHLMGYTFDKDQKRFVKHQPNPHNYKAYVDNDA